MVGATYSAEGGHSIHTVAGGGSSIDFRSTLKVPGLIRSASSMISTRWLPVAGARCAVMTRARTSSLAIDSLSVATTVTSGWVPAAVVRQARQVPHPGPTSKRRGAAKARAAVGLPEPGGAVISQAGGTEAAWGAAR